VRGVGPVRRAARLDLLTLDELGYLALDRRRANLVFQVVSRRYERGSVILTTNRRFDTWAELFAGDGVIAAAILDRLLHHRQLVVINCPSYRTPDLTGGVADGRGPAGATTAGTTSIEAAGGGTGGERGE
jgi:DNA replication protein DnaC